MSTIKSSAEDLTLNADGSGNDIKFQSDGVEKASISSAGLLTSTTIDATALTGNLPAIDGSSLTGISAGTALTGSTNNTIPTVTGANAISGEANLTFDGTDLTIGAGDVAASGTITSNGQAQLNNNNLISTNTGSTGEWIGKRTSSGEGIHITTTNASGTDTQRLAITCNADSADFIVKDSDIVFGTAGKGICLGVTSNTDANTLDDYEEGTWTPITLGTNTGGTGTYDRAWGYYTKVGNVVTCIFNVKTTAHTGSGGTYLGGLPFTSKNCSTNWDIPINGEFLQCGSNGVPKGHIHRNDVKARIMKIDYDGGESFWINIVQNGVMCITGSFSYLAD